MASSVTTSKLDDVETAATKPPLVRFFMRPQAFEDGSASVELIETHISWVFLTDRFVYKLKKPVRFEFLDFSDVDQRRRACEDELRLNRRISPDVYLEILPITSESHGQFRLGGHGDPVDWVVKMVRLPAERSLDRLVHEQRLTASEVDSLASILSRFYQGHPLATLPESKYLADIEHHIRANSMELAKPEHELDSWQVQRLHERQLRFLGVGRDVLVGRVQEGRVVDGHGDLRPEHIYFIPAPQIIDCVEFSSEFRRIDVADELAFLSMECDRLQADWVGERIMNRYCEAANDVFWPPLINFYKCYRACVRAKVSALRAHQVQPSQKARLIDDCNDYLRLADRYAARLGAPTLVVVHGLSGTGKSTLAAVLANSLGCNHLSTDVVRRQLFGEETTRGEFNTGKYTSLNRQKVYNELYRIAEERLSHGLSTILDGTFLSAEARKCAIQLARAQCAQPLLVHCICPSSLAIDRMHQREEAGNSDSEFRADWTNQQRSAEEPNEPLWPVCTVDTSLELPVNLQKIYNHLRSLIL